MGKRQRIERERREKKRIARERIDVLFTMAERVFPYSRELANRYVELALAVQKKARIKMPREWKRRYCKKCHSFLVPGKNARVRLRSRPYPHVVVKCMECGHISRYPYLGEKKRKGAENRLTPQSPHPSRQPPPGRSSSDRP